MPNEPCNWVYDQVSVRDAEVASRCAEDMTVVEIAEELGIGESTVYDHMNNVHAVIEGKGKRYLAVARWWRDEGRAYYAWLGERLLLDDDDVA